MTRKEAKALGNKTYHSKPCNHCESTERYVSSFGCVKCTSRRSHNNEYLREYSKRPNARERRYGYKIHRTYGIDLNEYNSMREKQNFSCAICSEHESKVMKTRLFVDHDHITGTVRGLLCHSCNAGIGMLKDSIDLLKKAQAYLGE